jgi:hypothetical protein
MLMLERVVWARPKSVGQGAIVPAISQDPDMGKHSVNTSQLKDNRRRF